MNKITPTLPMLVWVCQPINEKMDVKCTLIHITLICAFVIIPTGKFYLIFYFREEKKWLLSLQMFVMIPCLKSACILFDLSLQHSHFFIQQNNPTYCMLFPNNLNIHTFSCHQKFIKEISPKLTLQYIFLKYWRFKTAIAESNSDFDKSPDLIRLHAHSINFQNQLLYQVFSFFTEINFHKKIIWTSSTYKKIF